jgi:large subunit ribosomal protein L15
MIELHNLKSAAGSRKKRKRVGRGPASGTGKTAGKGHKGAQSRTGYARRYGFEGGQNPLHRRLPKRGFYHEKRWPVAIVNLDTLNEAFEDGAEVTTEALVQRGLAQDYTGGVKVLARGEVSKKFTLRVQAISGGAREKVEAAGGSVEIVSMTGAEAASEQQ